jgi:hypothetical protein
MAMIRPAVVTDPDPDKEEISLQDIDFMDKIAIFNLVTQPAAVLKNFRRDQEKRLAALRDGNQNRAEAELSSISEG